MASRSDAYVDTSALIAFPDDSDTWHALFRRLFSESAAPFTTPLVIAEGHAWFLRRHDSPARSASCRWSRRWTPLEIVAHRPAPEGAAGTQLLRRFSDQDLTLTDAIGLHS